MEIQDIISSGLLEMYVLGLADRREIIQIEIWIKNYPEVSQELKDIQISLENYIRFNQIEPSSGIKDKILSSLHPASRPVPIYL